MRTLLLGVISALGLYGCGEWVDYEGDPPSATVVTPGADDLDEAARGDFAALQRLDHLILEGLLAQYVVDGGDGYTYVDYAGLGERPEARALLDQYLAILDLVQPAGLESDAERVAYWFNAYNAAVVRGVLDQWGGDPQWSVSRGAFAFFDYPIWSFGGLVLSLNQVEHGVIRGDMDHVSLGPLDEASRAAVEAAHGGLWGGQPADPRLHVALNCASLSCPNLAAGAPYAFRAAVLDAQLEALTRQFLAHPGKGAGPEGISSLFLWYRSDFEAGGAMGAEDFIARHREGGMEGVDAGRYLTYDWTLNVAPTR